MAIEVPQDDKGRRVQYQIGPDAGTPAAAGTGDATRESGGGAIAVLVAHGMGQQVPFETLGTFVEGLRRQAGVPDSPIVARTDFVTQPGGGRERISRIEATLLLDGQPRVVHFFELYFAPLTEGVATLRDVIRFLFNAGLGRLTPARWRFDRWVFGSFRTFGYRLVDKLLLILALAVVSSLVVLNAAIVAAVGASLAGAPSWLTADVLGHLVRTFGLLLSMLVVFGLVVLLSSWRQLPPVARTSLRWASVLLFAVVLVATMTAALITTGSLTGRWPLMLASIVRLGAWADGLQTPIWVALAVASWFIRLFLVRYVGDVAIYIESQSLDRFSRVRQAIRDAAMKTARAVYGAGQYSHIAMAGHSLGSVVMYDTLNQLLLEDPGRRARTRLLMTFGSPLDKTAYLFGSQVGNNPARELLAASLQPLIQDKALRPRWVNIYSPSDLIGGSLEYYDDPDDPPDAPHRVVNLVDPDATTLVAAHNEHWTGTFIYRTFLEELERTIKGGPALRGHDGPALKGHDGPALKRHDGPALKGRTVQI